MDAQAKALAQQCHPHVPTALLAHLWRAGEAFPPLGEARSRHGVGYVRARLTCLGVEFHGDGDYLRFWCDDCHSVMFQPNTDRGIAHGLKVDGYHKPDCCAERKARYESTGIPPVWPDGLDE